MTQRRFNRHMRDKFKYRPPNTSRQATILGRPAYEVAAERKAATQERNDDAR